MKNSYNILALGAVLAMLSACNDELDSVYTVGEADNAIVLQAGVIEGANAKTRADGDPAPAPTLYSAFSGATKLRLRVDGTWLGKSLSDNLVSKATTASTAAEASTDTDNDTHNDTHGVTFTSAEQLYWDDYGTADPANMSPNEGNGRDKGLTIYGVAVNGKASLPAATDDRTGLTNFSDWKNITWNVGKPSSSNVIDQNTTNYWTDFDLLTSNNVRTGTGADGTYTFANRDAGKLLKFTHAMTKITVKLTAGEGFPGWGSTNTNDGKFAAAPEVTLKGFNYTGTVDVELKTSTPTTSTTADIKMHNASTGNGVNQHVATFDALVFPGNSWTDDTSADAHDGTKNNTIITFTADGNNYEVTAKKLFDALPAGNKTLLQGYNYVINITVNKTRIEVLSATIEEWNTLEAANETPVINLHSVYGQSTTDNSSLNPFGKDNFDFLRSLSVNSAYNDKTVVTHSSTTTESVTTHTYELATPRYWPDHSTHYFFRGIWPKIVAEGEEGSPKLSTKTVGETNYDAIAVENCAYSSGSSPSDLMIAMPRKADGNPDEACKEGHKEADNKTPKAGICSTESSLAGGIHMNFQYAMSQVEVILSTSGVDAADRVNIDANTTVEIINGYKDGHIYLCDGLARGNNVGSYFMNLKSGVTSGTFLDAVIPQSLTNGSNLLKFKVTIKNGEDNYDVYETVNGIKDINVKGSDTDKLTDKWEPGKHYVYELYITKTNIYFDATIKDWVEVKGHTNIVM